MEALSAISPIVILLSGFSFTSSLRAMEIAVLVVLLLMNHKLQDPVPIVMFFLHEGTSENLNDQYSVFMS